MAQSLAKVKSLERFIEKYGEDAFIAQTISKMMVYKAEEYSKEIQRLTQELRKFEQVHKKESSIFFKEFDEGKLDDEMDFIEWSSLYKMRNRLVEKKKELEGMI